MAAEIQAASSDIIWLLLGVPCVINALIIDNIININDKIDNDNIIIFIHYHHCYFFHHQLYLQSLESLKSSINVSFSVPLKTFLASKLSFLQFAPAHFFP